LILIFTGFRIIRLVRILLMLSVVATTRQNGTCSMFTSAKLSVGYLVVEIYKRTWQGALAELLPYLYKL